MATRTEQIEFVKKIYPSAKELFRYKNGINPLFVTAQAALETSWRILPEVGNNILGITKGSSWKGAVKLILTIEYFNSPDVKFNEPERVASIIKIDGGKYRYQVYRLFRVYDSIAACLEDHLSVLRKPLYADAWPYRNDAKEYARRIVDETGAKYATAPNYASVMASIIDSVDNYVNLLGL
jgi:flagellar protein FlgJ